MTRALIALLAAYAGCYSPSYRDCEVTCASSQTCPSGLMCSNNFCVAAPGTSCGTTDGGGMDAEVDAQVLGAWGMPSPVQIEEAAVNDDDPSVSSDGLELYFNRIDTGVSKIYRSVRGSTAALWPAAAIALELDSGTSDGTPELSPDGKSIYWSSGRPPSMNNDVWFATRTSAAAVWENPAQVVELSSPEIDASPAISRDGLTLVLYSLRSGNADLFISDRGPGKPWPTPVPIDAVNQTTSIEESPFLSDDKLTLYFNSNRTGDHDIYMATRATTSDVFGPPTPITEVSLTGTADTDPFVSPDGRHMYFSRLNAGGTGVLYEAVR